MVKIDRVKAKSWGYSDAEISAFEGQSNPEPVAEPVAPVQVDRIKAKSWGYSEQEISDFEQNPTYPTPAPTPSTSQNQSAPDFVTPMTNDNFVMTQGMGENPDYYGPGGHKGEDIAYTEPAQSYDMKNPIGGVPFGGTSGDFGNSYGVIGASPAELAQMTPEQKSRMSSDASSYMNNNPSDIQGMSGMFPGKNINLQGHLADAPNIDTMGVATGSARLKQGNTGNSQGSHLHNEFLSTEGALKALSEMLAREKNKTR